MQTRFLHLVFTGLVAGTMLSVSAFAETTHDETRHGDLITRHDPHRPNRELNRNNRHVHRQRHHDAHRVQHAPQ